MIDELLAILPRCSSQVAMTEGPDQQLRLVQPRRVRRREPGAPPTPALLPVGGRVARGVTGVAVLDQEHPLESAMTPMEEPQLLDIMLGILGAEHGQFHPTGMDDQKQQEIDRPVADVLELSLLDRAGPSPSDRFPLQDLEVGDTSSTATVQRPRRASRAALA